MRITPPPPPPPPFSPSPPRKTPPPTPTVPPPPSPPPTVVCTLLQPSPEVWDCFDDVLLVSQGRVAFFGPRPQLLPFFAGLGLAPLPGQTAADFAQEVAASAEDQIKYRVAVGQAAHGAGGQPPALPAWAGRKWVSPKMIRQVSGLQSRGVPVKPAALRNCTRVVAHGRMHQLEVNALPAAAVD